jgi:RNA recognition motif-containing protein
MNLMNGDPSFAAERHVYPTSNMYDPRHDPKALGNDLIPTAIVIKNIPFNVRKEMLTTIMSELGLPQPYAFNYHFDNGIFRGLAFANFQSPIDTQTVIEQLNGYEVQGRKLRVEYKKMLPEHERERIEREKREKRGQLEEQHQPITTLHSQSSMHSLSAANAAARSRNSPLRKSMRNCPTRFDS